MTRGADGKFAPGTSGNPGGRPKGPAAEMRALAQGHRDAALATLVEIMSNKRAKPSARVSAANALLDRGFGKPIALNAEVDTEGNDVPRDELSEFERTRRLASVVSIVLGRMGLTAEQAKFNKVASASLVRMKHPTKEK